MTRPLNIDQVQFGAKVGRHMLDYGRDPSSAADRDWLLRHIQDIYTNAAEFREGTFAGQGPLLPSGSNARGLVWFYAKGDDVVVTDKLDNFVTILKGGASHNTSYLLAARLSHRP